MEVIISHAAIKALLLTAAKYDARGYLNTVCVDVREHDVVLVATNGHVLLAVPAERVGDPIIGKHMIPREALEAVKPAKAGKIQFPIHITAEAGAPSVTIRGATTVTADLHAGTYPEWRRVVPAKASGQAVQFNPEYVALFGTIAKLLYVPAETAGKKGKKDAAENDWFPVIHYNGEAGSLVTNLGGAIGVIMPMRFSGAHPGLPAWAVLS